ncbi:MAG: methyl-accepting chemotaxis protein, partial [Comamonas sp.]
ENASLVGQAGHAAQALSERARDLQLAVGAFKLDDDEGAAPVVLSRAVSTRPALALAD